MNQRWRERKAIFRRPDEQIRTSEYDVAPLPDDTTAKAFVERHHYSRAYPAARFRFGLFRRAHLVGVAVFSHPMNDRVLTNVFGGTATESVELGRFVLLDHVPGNGETWFLARCFELLRCFGLRGVVSFSDPVPRSNEDGVVVFPGHVGTIYQAFNGRYVGRGKARRVLLLPDGRVFSHRAEQKIRNLERGWEYAVTQLGEFGATGFDPEDRLAWLRQTIARLCRPLKHPGNFKYAWALARGLGLPDGLPYPKLRVAA